MAKEFGIEVYADAEGTVPFTDWLLKLKDAKARAKIAARIDRASHGNFGDWKQVKGAKGVFEMREHYGPGYRIYYAIPGGVVVLLLAGSTKRDQKRMIAAAKVRLSDYFERSKDDDNKDKEEEG